MVRYIKSYAILLSGFLCSCATISYTPTVSLDVSSGTIEKSLLVEKIIDNSPEKDRKNPFSGFSVTNEKAIPNDFDLVLTNALVSDFSNNGVFNFVSRRMENPDFIMKGEITRFRGTTKLTHYGIITLVTIYPVITWWFGPPVYKNEVDIVLTLSFFDKEGNEIGKYTGTDSYFERTSIYKNNALAVPNYTNRSLSKAVMQIREQILKDSKSFE